MDINILSMAVILLDIGGVGLRRETRGEYLRARGQVGSARAICQ